jgi:serine protease Do
MSCRKPALSVIAALLLAVPALADSPPLTKEPTNIKELKDLQSRVQDVYKKVAPAVVGIQIGGASGSGVIVTEDGLVLTAGHVSGKPDSDCYVIFPDGKRLKAKSLGQDKAIDSGMIKIIEPGSYPYIEMGDSKTLQKGQWVVSLGHPGGFVPGRSPVLRLGRIINNNDSLIQTDCTLVGGDSGGPLFDLDGKVVGIHSRIGQMISFNIHVPVATYRDKWDDLVAGKSMGENRFGPRPNNQAPARSSFDLGARYELSGGVLKVADVKAGSLAERAGLKPKDLIMKFDGKSVANADEIRDILQKKKSGDEITLEVDRGAERLTLKLTVKS